MRLRVEAALVGVVLAVLVIGLTLGVVTRPWLTTMLVDRVGSADLAGLTAAQTRSLAQQVRAYVTTPDPPALPAIAAGRPAFDAAQVAHLDDVRTVMLAARVTTFITAALSAVWLGWCVVRRRTRALVAALRVAGALLVTFVLVVAVAGALDFDVLFTRFHALFFAAGSWTFAWEDLVIQLFPALFWVAAAAVWGALVLVSGGILLASSALLGRHHSTPRARDEW